mmetsp:Transcript_45689/g.85637  ORF Transcript_45689/g.85637 Transcript_45689/m.85637 type:complete len:234 (+) Transcript_45689:625-1326(+)
MRSGLLFGDVAPSCARVQDGVPVRRPPLDEPCCSATSNAPVIEWGSAPRSAFLSLSRPRRPAADVLRCGWWCAVLPPTSRWGSCHLVAPGKENMCESAPGRERRVAGIAGTCESPIGSRPRLLAPLPMPLLLLLAADATPRAAATTLPGPGQCTARQSAGWPGERVQCERLCALATPEPEKVRCCFRESSTFASCAVPLVSQPTRSFEGHSDREPVEGQRAAPRCSSPPIRLA